jgi:hypothetical protein
VAVSSLGGDIFLSGCEGGGGLDPQRLSLHWLKASSY